jgi:hypothetical protein
MKLDRKEKQQIHVIFMCFIFDQERLEIAGKTLHMHIIWKNKTGMKGNIN